jgi:hypothetical protein
MGGGWVSAVGFCWLRSASTGADVFRFIHTGPTDTQPTPNRLPTDPQPTLHLPRNEGYDAPDLTTKYLNLPEVKADLKARPEIVYVSCSPEVGRAVGRSGGWVGSWFGGRVTGFIPSEP